MCVLATDFMPMPRITERWWWRLLLSSFSVYISVRVSLWAKYLKSLAIHKLLARAEATIVCICYHNLPFTDSHFVGLLATSSGFAAHFGWWEANGQLAGAQSGEQNRHLFRPVYFWRVSLSWSSNHDAIKFLDYCTNNDTKRISQSQQSVPFGYHTPKITRIPFHCQLLDDRPTERHNHKNYCMRARAMEKILVYFDNSTEGSHGGKHSIRREVARND